jgi:hypothetical protein
MVVTRQAGDGVEQDTPVAEQHAQRFQIGFTNQAQRPQIETVFGKGRGVLRQTQFAEPVVDVAHVRFPAPATLAEKDRSRGVPAVNDAPVPLPGIGAQPR